MPSRPPKPHHRPPGYGFCLVIAFTIFLATAAGIWIIATTN